MTRKEVAQYIGISLAKLAMIQSDIKHMKIGRVVRFRKEDVDAYISEHSKTQVVV